MYEVPVAQLDVSPQPVPSPAASVQETAPVEPDGTVRRLSEGPWQKMCSRTNVHELSGVMVMAKLKPSVTVGLKKSKLLNLQPYQFHS